MDALPLIPIPQTNPGKASWCGLRSEMETLPVTALERVGKTPLALLNRNLRKGRLLFREATGGETVLAPKHVHWPNLDVIDADCGKPRSSVIRIEPANIGQHRCHCPDTWLMQHVLLPRRLARHDSTSSLTLTKAVEIRSDYRQMGRLYFDMPAPHLLDTRSWRCRTCNESFPVAFSDVQTALPEALRCRTSRGGEIWFSPRWLIHIILKYAETMNMRATRRFVLDTYSTAVLRADQRWYISRVPGCKALTALVRRALGSYLPDMVACMEAEVHCFAGGALRGDGHFKLPMRLRDSDHECLYGWLGADSALLSPPQLLKSEKLEHLLPDLKRLAVKMMLRRSWLAF